MKNKTEALILKNSYLKFFIKLLDVPLHSSEARARNRIFKIILAKEDDREKGRIEILNRIGKLNKKENRYELTDPVKFSKEYEKLQSEDVIIDLLPSVKSDIPVIKKIIEKTNLEMNFEETEILEAIIKELSRV